MIGFSCKTFKKAAIPQPPCVVQAASTALEPEVIELVHYFKIGDRQAASKSLLGMRMLHTFWLSLGRGMREC